MIYKAKQLNSYLTHLQLTTNPDGGFEFIGNDKQWERANEESKETKCERCKDLFEMGYDNGNENVCQICYEHLEAELN